jgi:HTH-type transcriptional regulator / antitoxin HigA
MRKELKPIRTEADHEAALSEVERLWGAKSGTAEGNRLDILATLIDAYEAQQYPMDPPDPIEAIKFRMEHAGPDPEGPGTHHRNADACRRGAEPQAGAVD